MADSPTILYDTAGRPYCADCGDSGSGPCRYHWQQTQRRILADTLDREHRLMGTD
jgi:hypothetical protein